MCLTGPAVLVQRPGDMLVEPIGHRVRRSAACAARTGAGPSPPRPLPVRSGPAAWPWRRGRTTPGSATVRRVRPGGPVSPRGRGDGRDVRTEQGRPFLLVAQPAVCGWCGQGAEVVDGPPEQGERAMAVRGEIRPADPRPRRLQEAGPRVVLTRVSGIRPDITHSLTRPAKMAPAFRCPVRRRRRRPGPHPRQRTPP